jgi:predicted dienelactone hydrolase
MRSLLLTPFVLLALWAFAAFATERVGIDVIRVADPESQAPMQGYILYPAAPGKGQANRTELGPYVLHGYFQAAVHPGRYPLVVISHGSGGSALGHHDLAEYLAGHGYVVASITHPKDNFADTSGVGSPDVFVGRPRQVSAVIDALLGGEWRNRIDPSRIGVAGFSAGGYTALVLAGALPRFELIFGYCERHPRDANLCRFGAEKRSRESQAAIEQLQGELDRALPLRDTRIKAAFAMAPLSVFFEKTSLQSVRVPIFLAFGDRDDVLLPDENGRRIAHWLPDATVTEIKGAGHWTFLAPCSDALRSEAPGICKDDPTIDRRQVHKQLNEQTLRFFSKNLSARTST